MALKNPGLSPRKKAAEAFASAAVQYRKRDLNPHKAYASTDFKSVVSTIPPFLHLSSPAITHF